MTVTLGSEADTTTNLGVRGLWCSARAGVAGAQSALIARDTSTLDVREWSEAEVWNLGGDHRARGADLVGELGPDQAADTTVWHPQRPLPVVGTAGAWRATGGSHDVPTVVLLAAAHLGSGTLADLTAALESLLGRTAQRLTALDPSTAHDLEPWLVAKPGRATYWMRALLADRAFAPTVSPSDFVRQAGEAVGGVTRKALRYSFDQLDRLKARQLGAPVPVVGIYGSSNMYLPVGLPAVMAYAERHSTNLDETLELIPVLLCPERLVARAATGPAIILLSDYIWSIEENTRLAQAAKAAEADTIVIRGGPQVPKYEGDLRDYFDRHGAGVDIAVHGEGEATLLELLQMLARHTEIRPDGRRVVRRAELDLASIAGISYRGSDGQIVTTDARERIQDLALLASPYRSGVLATEEIGLGMAIVESNRGCPYACSFCDWGAATMSRIRKRPMDEVLADLTAVAKAGVGAVVIGDANFGIFERDVEIASHLADLRREYGVPHMVGFNYAKNNHRYLNQILKILADSGIQTPPILSLQTLDNESLVNVKRSNIKIAAYERLADEFRAMGSPVRTELMIGLPGSNQAKVLTDLQFCIDRALLPTLPRTWVLVNAPMNDPEYRARFQITTDDLGRICSTTSYTYEDLVETMGVISTYRMAEIAGIFRYVMRFCADETGRREADLIEDVYLTVRADPTRYPGLADAVTMHCEDLAAPWPYGAWLAEFAEFARERWGVVWSSAATAVWAAQEFVLPGEATPPASIELAHDVQRWIIERVERKREQLPPIPLRDYGPATLTIRQRSRLTDGAMSDLVLFQLEHDTEMALMFALAQSYPTYRACE